MAIEAAHKRAEGEHKPYYQIAVEIYDNAPTQSYVQAEIERRYGVRLGRKTTSLWINRGLAARRQALGAA